MADPAPVAQTFFVEDSVKKFFRLDGIVTMIDAKHVEQHLDDERPEGVENEAVEQVAFADRMLLNKTDLVTAGLHYLYTLTSVEPMPFSYRVPHEIQVGPMALMSCFNP